MIYLYYLIYQQLATQSPILPQVPPPPPAPQPPTPPQQLPPEQQQFIDETQQEVQQLTQSPIGMLPNAQQVLDAIQNTIDQVVQSVPSVLNALDNLNPATTASDNGNDFQGPANQNALYATIAATVPDPTMTVANSPAAYAEVSEEELR